MYSEVKEELERMGLDSNSFDYMYKYLIDNNILDRLDEYTNRLLSGEPVQYIIGNVDFYGNTIKVNKNVLIPRFETELLVEKTIKLIRNKYKDKINILDIGTGSGCIAITLSKEVNSNVVGCDISTSAIALAKENAALNNTLVDFIESDVFSNIIDKYDVIISNPPYISKDEKIMDIVYNNEPHTALFADNNGLYFYDIILRECKKYLKDNFIIAFEIGESQGNDIIDLCNKYLDNINTWVEKDLSGRDRYIFIESKNS